MFLTALASCKCDQKPCLYGTGCGKVGGKDGYKQGACLWGMETPASSKPQGQLWEVAQGGNWGQRWQTSYDTVLFQGISGEKQGQGVQALGPYPRILSWKEQRDTKYASL